MMREAVWRKLVIVQKPRVYLQKILLDGRLVLPSYLQIESTRMMF
jgi:hypothetical protein